MGPPDQPAPGHENAAPEAPRPSAGRSRAFGKRARSLRLRVLVPLVATGLLIGLAGALTVRKTYERQLDEHMRRRGESIAHALDAMIRSAVYTQINDEAKDQTMRRIVAELGDLPDVTLIVVVSGEPPIVTATTHDAWEGLPIEDLPYERVQEDLFDAIETRRLHPHFHAVTQEYDVSWPLALHTAHRPRGEPADGAIMLHLDAKPVRAQLRRAAAETTAALLGAILAVGLITWWLLDRLVLGRIGRIERVLHERTSGSRGTLAPEMGYDEIGRAAVSLNTMLCKLDDADAEIRRSRDHLEELVQERTTELRDSHDRLRQSDRLATIGTMAAGVAHDLNNLLLPLRSHLHVLERTAPDAHEQIEEMRQSVRFLQQLADSMRLCALDPTDESASAGTTDLGAWWKQVEGLLERALKSRVGGGRAVLTGSVGEELVALPPHRLTQAVLNLIVNAGDACATSPRAEVRVEAHREAGGVELRVTDTGCGMPPEVLARATDPFFTTKKRGASSGLGLAMVRSIVESSGGSLGIQTAPGKGTAVILRLPLAESTTTASPGGVGVRVATTLSDERLAALVHHGLRETAHVVSVDAEPPPAAEVWVIEPACVSPATARAFVGSGGRLIVIGPTGQNEGWPSSSVRTLPVSFSIERLQDAVHDPTGNA